MCSDRAKSLAAPPTSGGGLNTRVPPHQEAKCPESEGKRLNKLPGSRGQAVANIEKIKVDQEERGKPSLYGALPVPIAQPQPRLGTVLLQIGELLGIDGSPSLLPYVLHSILVSHT